LSAAGAQRPLFVIIPTGLLVGFVGWFVDDSLALSARAGSPMVAYHHVKDRHAGDGHRQNWYEPEFHSHNVILRFFMVMIFSFTFNITPVWKRRERNFGGVLRGNSEYWTPKSEGQRRKIASARLRCASARQFLKLLALSLGA